MGKCYCDYCDVFLTNDSVAVRKQHNDGNRHKYNVCEYYRQYVGQKLQEQIDDIVDQFEDKVAKGLIRPTYGLPPPPPINNNTTSKDEPADKEAENSPTEKPKLPETSDENQNDSNAISNLDDAVGGVVNADASDNANVDADASDNAIVGANADANRDDNTNAKSTRNEFESHVQPTNASPVNDHVNTTQLLKTDNTHIETADQKAFPQTDKEGQSTAPTISDRDISSREKNTATVS